MGNTAREKYKIKFVDRVLDPVHGFVDLTQVEKEIVELPIFKRTQGLKQLSLTNWVFPGAEHTRYIHSIGVMYIADLMASHIKDKNGNLYFNDGDRQLLRLAGLLHDIGHYPLSHVTEQVYESKTIEECRTIKEYNEKTKHEIDRLSNSNIPIDDYMKDRYSKPFHHETVGTKVIESDKDIKGIIRKHCGFIDIRDIEDIIVGCVERNPRISVMVQLIHSELDADGIDYVMRDATFSGTSYGGFELGLLLRNLVVKDYNGIDIVCVLPKGISVVDQYLISKYFSYTQVIFNKHVAIFDKMAEMITATLVRLNKSPYPQGKNLDSYIKNHNKNDFYLHFTDSFFWHELSALQKNDIEGEDEEQYNEKIIDKLSHYQEFNQMEDGMFTITTDNPKAAFKALSHTTIYKHLKTSNNKGLVLFHSRGFTNEIKTNEFEQALKSVSTSTGEDFQKKFVEKNLRRLQEGISIATEDDDIRLLVDDSRSIMSHLYKTKTYIIRSYEL